MSGQAIVSLEPLEGAGTEISIRTRARGLGLLADAILVEACFGEDATRLGRVVDILEMSVDLWRRCPVDQLDEAALAQDLSNLCFQYGQEHQRQDLRKAEEMGWEALGMFGRLRHPRLAQAQQHLAHVFKGTGNLQQALDFYKRSVATCEKSGAAGWDSEYACSLSSVAIMLNEMHDEEPPWTSILALFRAAVVSVETICGSEHPEVEYYRRLLANSLWQNGQRDPAIQVLRGEAVTLSDADREAMRAA